MTLTESEKQRIETLAEEGWTQQEIADEMGCSQPTVSMYAGEYDASPRFSMAKDYPSIQIGSDRVYIHRLIAAVDHSLGELAGCHVHHKNESTLDNSQGNLEVVTPKEHQERHA